MTVEIDSCALFPSDHAIDVFEFSQQANERGLAFNDNGRCTFGFYQRSIAGELNGIAEALLGMQKNTPARQIASVPSRFDKLRRSIVFAPPPPFIFLPAGRIVAQRQKRQGFVPMRLG